MRGALLLSLCFAAATTGCAIPPKATPIFTSSQPTTIVLATAIIAPEALVNVVTDAVSVAPESAVVIAAAAAAAAPNQAATIRATVVKLAPADADTIAAVTKVKRGQAVTRIEIPNHDRLAALVERATR